MDVRKKGFFKLMPVDEALKILLGKVAVIGGEVVGIEGAVGRVLAREVISKSDIPPFARAAMDGYAVRGENTFGASQTNPVYLKVIGEVIAGESSKLEIGEFEAIKIMTGSQMPKGSDAVVMFEHTRVRGSEVEILNTIPPGKNVSSRGEDVKKGDILLKKGRILKPHDIGVLAALGESEIDVCKKPTVAIISTGNELLKPGEKIREGKVYDSNTYALSSCVESSGGIPVRLGLVKDDYAKIEKAISKALEYDVVILSGATSVGEKDIIPEIVSEKGEILVHGVAMRPGEPTGFGLISKKLVFMLPGYPVAAIFGFETFVRPALQKMQGMDLKSPYPQIKAILNRKVASELGRRDFLRVRIEKKSGKFFAEPIRSKGAGVISSLVRADGFVVVPETTEGLEEGKEVTVNLFEPVSIDSI